MKKQLTFTIGIIIFLLNSCQAEAIVKATGTPSPSNTPTFFPTLTLTLTPTPIGRSSGRILFSEQNIDNESTDIMIIDLNTGEITNLTNNKVKDTFYDFPSVSSDGNKIVYCLIRNMIDTESKEEYGKYEIYIMDIDGKNQQKITTIPMFKGTTRIDEYIYEFFPAWSPDSKKIAFVSNREILLSDKNYDEEIFVIDLDSNEIKQLTKASGYSEHPSWSPDGNQIAFMSDRDGDWDIYIMNSDGTGKDEKITNYSTSERYPSWSHDGKNIVYHSDRDGNINLYSYNLETKEESQLTNNVASDFTGRWSPDDQWIVFSSDRDGDEEIFILNILTKEEIKITDNQVGDGFQSWIP